jgi:hypothetical protein
MEHPDCGRIASHPNHWDASLIGSLGNLFHSPAWEAIIQQDDIDTLIRELQKCLAALGNADHPVSVLQDFAKQSADHRVVFDD